MGYRCPAPLKFLWLALALSQGNLLGSQQAAPGPAAPAPAANRTGVAKATPADAPDFRKDNLSHLRLERGDRTFDIYLFAPDQIVDVLSASFCGGDEAAKQFSGHFQLLSVADNSVVSTLDLDPDTNFVERKPHDGARLLRDPKSGQNLVALYQYGSCNSESVQFYSADPDGDLFAIPFLDHDGHIWKQMLTGPDGAIPHLPNGALVFCSYDHDFGYDFCEAYSFDGANFQEAAKWMTQELAAPIKGMNDAALAARALFEFLSMLSMKEYGAAAYFMDGDAGPAGPEQVAARRGQKAASLEKYCTVMGGQCLMPVKMERQPSEGTLDALLFQVSFQTSDFQPFMLGARSNFEFRVAKTADGFKVLDLPPRLPPENSRQ
jgi:hypothetical protein